MEYCPECGTELDGEPSYCPDCGHSLSEDGSDRRQSDAADEEETDGGILPIPSSPLGVKLLCLLAIFGGLINLAAGSLLITVNQPLLGAFSVLMGLAVFPMVYGLLMMRAWGWKYAIGLYLINVVVNIFTMLTGNPVSAVGALIGLFILWYLWTIQGLYLEGVETVETTTAREQADLDVESEVGNNVYTVSGGATVYFDVADPASVSTNQQDHEFVVTDEQETEIATIGVDDYEVDEVQAEEGRLRVDLSRT